MSGNTPSENEILTYGTESDFYVEITMLTYSNHVYNFFHFYRKIKRQSLDRRCLKLQSGEWFEEVKAKRFVKYSSATDLLMCVLKHKQPGKLHCVYCLNLTTPKQMRLGMSASSVPSADTVSHWACSCVQWNQQGIWQKNLLLPIAHNQGCREKRYGGARSLSRRRWVLHAAGG